MEFEKVLGQFSEFFISTLKKYKKEELGANADFTDITWAKFVYLEAIHKMKNPTFSDLAQKLNVTKPSVTAVVNKLIDENFLYKEQSEDDRRVYFLYLDKKGQQLMNAHDSASIRLVSQVRGCLTADEANSLMAIYNKIMNSFGQK